MNAEYYPTPAPVIARMLSPFTDQALRKMQILDPEAGGAAVLDYLTKVRQVPQKNVYAIEQDAELVYTLQGKNYKVIHTDFLTYSGNYLFDLIIMNPPFSNGDEHLLRAWDVLESGDIVCLLNTETINNPCTARRKLLKRIIEENGSVESLGDCFRQADRPTAVDITMVRLTKVGTDAQFSFDCGATRETPVDLTEEVAGNKVAMYDLTGTLLGQYDRTRQAYSEYIRARRKLEYFSRDLVSEYVNVNTLAEESYKGSRSDREAYNSFLTTFKAEAWSRILDKLKISKYLTNSVMNDFEKFKKGQGAMDLTRENIASLIDLLLLNRDSIMERAVTDVFDLFTRHHKENRVHIEGWKTNDFWRVNRKIVLPGYLGDIRWSSHYSTSYHRHREFSDIEKVMCFLTGRDYGQLRPMGDYIQRVQIGDTSEQESEFFYFRCYKKGTLHLRFKDEQLWATFNQRACQGKNWLPTS